MTLTEIQTATPGPVRMAAMIHEPLEIVNSGSQVTVVDCPANAWNEADKPALLDLRNTFGDDLVSCYEALLYDAAHALIETHLVIEWRNRGFKVEFVHDTSAFEDGATPGPDGMEFHVPDDSTYLQVWQSAAKAITWKDLVNEAEMTDVFPVRTELERHRLALHHRLDVFAETAQCPQAEAQLDGFRAAVDGAVTRSRLIELSALIA
jgi:hypothetical protein